VPSPQSYSSLPDVVHTCSDLVDLIPALPVALRIRRAFSVTILLGPFRPQSTISTFDTFTFDLVSGVRLKLQ
jgi:hypothetical protein